MSRDRKRGLAVLAGLALMIAFALSNTGRVRVNFLVMSSDSRLIVVIIVSALLGALVSLVALRRH